MVSFIIKAHEYCYSYNDAKLGEVRVSCMPLAQIYTCALVSTLNSQLVYLTVCKCLTVNVHTACEVDIVCAYLISSYSKKP